MWVLDTDLGPLEEQWVLLTPEEASLQPQLVQFLKTAITL